MWFLDKLLIGRARFNFKTMIHIPSPDNGYYIGPEANLRRSDLIWASFIKASSSLQFCLALNSDIEGAITNVSQLLKFIKSNKSNEEAFNIYMDHLGWINNRQKLIENGYIIAN